MTLHGTRHIMPMPHPFHKEEAFWVEYLEQNPPSEGQPLSADIESLVLKFNHLLRWETKSKGDKKALLDELQAAAKPRRATSFVMDHLLLIADEWYTNAERCIRESLKGQIQVDLYHSDRSLWLFVLDDHGTLNLELLIQRISNAYRNGVLEVMERKQDGAGIGSFLAFRNSMSWLAAVRPNKETLLGARLLLDRTHDHMAQVAKSIHLPRGL